MKRIFTPLLILTTALGAGIASSQPPPVDSKSFSRAPLHDGQVLQIVRVLGKAEIAQAELALDISENETVKTLAETIRKDHERIEEDIDAVNDVTIDMEDSPLSDNLGHQGKAVHDQLAALEGTAFDCAYLNKQVENHQAALEIANTQLKHNARDVQVSSLVTSLGPMFESHLKLAREARGELGGCQQ